VKRGTSTKHTALGSIKNPKGKACHNPGQVKAKQRESEIIFDGLCCEARAIEVDISPSLSTGVLGSLGLGAVGGGVRVALAACLMWYLGVVAPRDMVMMMTRRGCFVRAQLPMMNVHDFHHGMFGESCLLCGTNCTCSCCCNCGPGDIPGHIHDPLKDCGVEFGQLVPALQCVQVVAWPQVVFGGS
jgi:hypothetical protein